MEIIVKNEVLREVSSKSAVFEMLIDEQEAAEFLGFTRRAMQNWRFRGGGPPFIKVAERSVRYRIKDLVAWIDSRQRSSTADH